MLMRVLSMAEIRFLYPGRCFDPFLDPRWLYTGGELMLDSLPVLALSVERRECVCGCRDGRWMSTAHISLLIVAVTELR